MYVIYVPYTETIRPMRTYAPLPPASVAGRRQWPWTSPPGPPLISSLFAYLLPLTPFPPHTDANRATQWLENLTKRESLNTISSAFALLVGKNDSVASHSLGDWEKFAPSNYQKVVFKGKF